jgi:hypothetical protein
VRAAAAVEGTSLRGTVRADGRRVHLLSAPHGYGVVLAQRGVDAKAIEITEVRPLLDGPHRRGGPSTRC